MRRRELLAASAVAVGLPLFSSSGARLDVMRKFADAWNAHDLDALMSFMADDCVFDASAGDAVTGTRYVGRDTVRQGYADVFATYPDARWNNPRHFAFEDRGISEWTFVGTRKDGSRTEVNGCDLFVFKGNKIALKNSYLKNRPVIPAAKA
jgi:steroid delta-isomerase-like uncharacterized protein